jgi:membrane protein YdbS with pleckstrin-like domain
LPLAVLVLAGMIVAIAPQRIYRRLRYRLSERLLQVMRGWLFHSDTVVPLVRVQHLDVVRGPFDKLFGTASLVVHTAGTRNSTITVPGLAPDRAAQMRDIIREHVRTDFA